VEGVFRVAVKGVVIEVPMHAIDQLEFFASCRDLGDDVFKNPIELPADLDYVTPELFKRIVEYAVKHTGDPQKGMSHELTEIEQFGEVDEFANEILYNPRGVIALSRAAHMICVNLELLITKAFSHATVNWFERNPKIDPASWDGVYSILIDVNDYAISDLKPTNEYIKLLHADYPWENDCHDESEYPPAVTDRFKHLNRPM